VTAATMAELRRRRDEASGADLVELRLDGVADPDVAGALSGRSRPVIVTCRPQWEGGRFSGSEEERRRILGQALREGAEYVDVEWRARFDDLVASTRGRGIVLSFHDFEGMPGDLADRVRAMRASGAEIVKVAATASRLTDCAALLDVVRGLGSNPGDREGLIAIAMGVRGVASRILAARFGSRWTYAGALQEVGQVTLDELRGLYNFRAITAATDAYGVVASPVAHSVSPAMHNRAYREGRLDAVYIPIDAADADDFVAFARALGLKGASVTIPFKVSLLNRMDEIDPVATRVGAINTIRVDGSRWLGTNTDVSGFLKPLDERGVPLAGMRAAILGSGGAARAAAVGLASRGATVSVHARNSARSEPVAAAGAGSVGPWPPAPGSWDLLVNCTPLGMYPRVDATPLPAASLGAGWVYDLVYNPPATRLLREAAAAGCRTIGGLEMLVSQAEAQFRWWTGQDPAKGVMHEAAAKRLSEFVVDENYVA